MGLGTDFVDSVEVFSPILLGRTYLRKKNDTQRER